MNKYLIKSHFTIINSRLKSMKVTHIFHAICGEYNEYATRHPHKLNSSVATGPI